MKKSSDRGNVLITGGNGFIGAAISLKLQSDGYNVISASRNNGYDFSSLVTANTWQVILEENKIDYVINAVGIIAETRNQSFDLIHSKAPIALFQSSKNNGVKRIIQISALGADETAFSAYHLSKKYADDFLRELDIDAFILRPSLVYGENGDSTKLLRSQAKLPITPVIDHGKSKIQPIHIDDVVEVVQRCVLHEKTFTTTKTIDLVGPEVFSLHHYYSLLRGKKIRAFNIPSSIMLAMCPIIEKLNPMVNAEAIKMLLAGNTEDVSDVSQILGRSPKSIKDFI